MRFKKRNLGELPSDLTVTDESMGPPPAWFRPEEKTRYWGLPYYFPFFAGLGEREAEVEVNPVEYLDNLKFKQEMSKRIPSVAYRYTHIDPLSPMFRADRARYGYGETGSENQGKLAVIIALVILLLVAKNLF